MQSGECLSSYPIEQVRTEETGMDSKKLTACAVDPDHKNIVVAFEGGKVQVNNLHSGGLVYNEAENTMILDSEVSELRFFGESCNFWFVAACWEGRVAFFMESQINRGRNYVKFQQSKGNHLKDVITLDINDENSLATASVDNVISFWNTFVGTESKHFKFPRTLVKSEINQNI